MKRSVVLVASLVLVSLLLSGCFAEREKVMVPPRADLRGAERVAVLYVENYTVDPGIGVELERAIAQELRGYYQIIDESTVESAMQRVGIRQDSLTEDDVKRLGDFLQVDAIIVGEATYYFDDVRQGVPTISRTYDEGTKARWTVSQETQVSVDLNARVINTRNGAILYSKRVKGSDSTHTSTMLAYDGIAAPPRSLVPSPTRRDIPHTRMRAVEDAVELFTADLLPTYVWRTVD